MPLFLLFRKKISWASLPLTIFFGFAPAGAIKLHDSRLKNGKILPNSTIFILQIVMLHFPSPLLLQFHMSLFSKYREFRSKARPL